MSRTLLLLFALLSYAHISTAQRSSWPMINGDAQRTSSSQLEISFPLAVTDEYNASLNGEGGMAVTDEYIFVSTSRDSNLIVAIDRMTGDSLWTFGVTGSGGSAGFIPAASNGVVLASGQGAAGLWGLDESTGAPRWFLPVRSLYTRSPIVSDGKAYVPAIDSLFCVDIESGEVEWSFRQTITQISPVCDDDYVYFGSQGRLYALDKEDGEENWSADVPNGTFDSYLLYDDLLYVSETLGAINAVDTDDGSIEWSYKLDSTASLIDFPGAFALADDRLIAKYLITDSTSNYYVVLDADTGDELSQFRGGVRTFNSPTLVIYGDSENPTVNLIEATSGTLTFYDISNGEDVYSFNFPGQGTSPQVIAADNKIFYAGNSRSVYVIESAPLSTREADRLISRIYPNPASDFLQVALDQSSAIEVDFDIMTLDGRLLQSIQGDAVLTGNGIYTLDVADLESGSYVLRSRTKSSSTGAVFTVIR